MLKYQGLIDMTQYDASNIPDEIDGIICAYLDNTMSGVVIDFKTGDAMINHSTADLKATLLFIKKTKKCIYSLTLGAA